MDTSTKTMSLQRYLFFTIALFVLLLAGTQLFFVNYIQQLISTEVEAKSRTLSKQAVDVLVDNLVFVSKEETQENSQSAVMVKIQKTPNEVITLDKNSQFVTGDQTETVKIETVPSVTSNIVRRKLTEDLHELTIAPVSNSYAFKVGFDNQLVRHQQIVQFDEQDSAINQYINWLSVAILIISGLGLFFAYWLARHISQPLAQLSKGFVSLEQGQFGKQVKSGGVKEVRETLKRFNHMSTRLAQLNEMEKRYQQQQQLAELGEITRGLAHTLRNPINTIGLTIEQISQAELTDKERSDLSIQARHKINHLDNTIKALLSLAASGIDRTQSIDVSGVIDDVIMELSMSGAQNISHSATQKVLIEGAESEVRAMIHTLLVNACEASAVGQSISIFCQLDKHFLQVKVVDEGCGLTPDIKRDLFKPHISSKPEGAGMGLYIAKRISQSYYRGDIQLTDNQPNGCVATLTLHTRQPKDAYGDK